MNADVLAHSWGVFFMFSSLCQKVCLLTLLFLAFKLLFEKILHHFFAFIRTDIRCVHLTLENLGHKQDVRFTQSGSDYAGS